MSSPDDKLDQLVGDVDSFMEEIAGESEPENKPEEGFVRLADFIKRKEKANRERNAQFNKARDLRWKALKAYKKQKRLS